MNILYILLALGIIGHAINMYCDRILSIFPNGTLKLVNYSKLKDGDYAAKLMEGVSPNVPMRSGVLGVFAIVLEFCGYAALAAYAYQKAPVYGAILFAGTTFACIVSSAYHLKCGLAEYMFLKYGRDERAKGMMLDLMGSGASLRLCSLGMLAFYVTLMVAIITGAIGFPIWALVFTILPIFLVMFPLQIVGTLHIAAMVSMLGWMFLILPQKDCCADTFLRSQPFFCVFPHSRGFFAKITKSPLTNAPIRAIIINAADDPPQYELHMESWLSGLRRTTGNRVWAYTPPRVQIPNSPPD